MTRQERFDTACALGIVAILLILLGSWLHSTSNPTPEPVSAAPVAAVVDIVDDNDSHPSGIRGMTVGELMRDAWLSYETQLGTPQPAIGEQFNTTAEYAASYDGQVPALDATYITIPSSEHAGVTHAFRMVASQRA